MKKIVIAIFGMLLALNFAKAQVGNPWTGDTALSFAGGTGTAADPYQIKTGAELMKLAADVNGNKGNIYVGTYFRIENDIDLGGNLETPSQWVAIGFRPAWSFKGILDGNGKKIHNIYQYNSSAAGKGSDLGGVVGSLGDSAIVRNLTVASGSISAEAICGGIVANVASGSKYPGMVENCYNYADVEALKNNAVGGITGSSFGVVSRCVNYGTVRGSYRAGGISGIVNATVNQVKLAACGLSQCVNLGTLVLPENASSATVGGLAGTLQGYASVRNAANFGTLNIGQFDGANSAWKVGGLIGEVNVSSGTVENSLFAGHVYVYNREVPVIYTTMNARDTVRNCYGDMQISAQSKTFLSGERDGAYCLPTDSLTMVAGLPGWDTEIWQFSEGLYPMLKCFVNRDDVKIASFVPHMSYTDKEVYDVFNAVRKDFTLPTGATWTIAKGTTAVMEGNKVKVVRLADKSDTIVLKATMGDVDREFLLVVLMESVPLTITVPEHGTVKVWNGEVEVVDGGKVEENTMLRMEAIPDDGYLLDYFLVDGERWEEPMFMLKGASEVSAVFMKNEDPEPWDGTVADRFGGGAGTVSAPYQVRTAAELAFLAKEVNAGNEYAGKYFVQVFNLDLNRHEWTPIGVYGGSDATSYGFAGTFDGCGKTVKNLSIKSSNTKRYLGLWGLGRSSGTIRNMAIDSGYINVNNEEAMVGMLIGDASSTVENCSVSGKIEGLAQSIGGISGMAGVTTIGCISRVNINAKANRAGGVTAWCMVGKILNCANLGDSIVVNGTSVGGVVGVASSTDITNCYNTAVVVNAGDNTGHAGGVAGMISQTSTLKSTTVEYCYNSGNVVANEAGGLVGFCSGSVLQSFNVGDIYGKTYAGGIVPRLSAPRETLANLYNLGTVSTSDPNGLFGEIMGRYEYGTMRNLYFDKQIKPKVRPIGSRAGEDSWGLVTRRFTDSLPFGFEKESWEVAPGCYPMLKDMPVSDALRLKSAALMLHVSSDSVYDTPEKMRFDARIFTNGDITWRVEKGTSITIVDNDLKVTAQEEIDTVDISATYKNLVKTYRLFVAPLRYVLTLNQPTGGTVAAATLDGQAIASGSELSPATKVVLSYIEADGYRFLEWFDHTTGETDTVSMTEDKTVTAVFAKKTFTIKALASEGGSITPMGEATVEYGASQVYTILPEDGFEGDSLIVDGKPVAFAATYTFTNVTSNHSIRVTFKAKMFKISATCNEGGSITPAGDTLIAYGQSITYTIKAAEGYKLDKLTVDGVAVDPVDTYTFNRVVAPHTIHAVFVADNVAVEDVLARNIEVRARDRQLMVSNRTGDAVQTILYNVSGVAVGTKRIACGATVYMPLPTDGMYMLRITDGRAIVIKKVMSL